MAGGDGWRETISISARFDTIQRLRQIFEGCADEVKANAFALARDEENKAFQSAGSSDEYRNAIDEATDAAKSRAKSTEAGWWLKSHLDLGGESVKIGRYSNCREVASGLTSTVYRSEDGQRALKVLDWVLPEPHSATREIAILGRLRPPCVSMIEHFVAEEPELRRVIVFPYYPLTLQGLLCHGALARGQVQSVFRDTFAALSFIASQGIIHRDVKPSAILLQSPTGPARLSDFGTAYHSDIHGNETDTAKVLDVGTGPYRSPDCLFGNASYGPEIDVWAAGVVLSEASRDPPVALFESRPAHEDGNQLGLILNIFQTIGSPTPETWPEAETFKTPPWSMWRAFPTRPWEKVLPTVDGDLRDLISRCLLYGGRRISAEEALGHPSLGSEHRE